MPDIVWGNKLDIRSQGLASGHVWVRGRGRGAQLPGDAVEPVRRVGVSRAKRAQPCGPYMHCSPRHRMTFNSRNEGTQCGSMTWRAMSARLYQPLRVCDSWHGARAGRALAAPHPRQTRLLPGGSLRASTRTEIGHARAPYLAGRMLILTRRGGGGGGGGGGGDSTSIECLFSMTPLPGARAGGAPGRGRGSPWRLACLAIWPCK